MQRKITFIFCISEKIFVCVRVHGVFERETTDTQHRQLLHQNDKLNDEFSTMRTMTTRKKEYLYIYNMYIFVLYLRGMRIMMKKRANKKAHGTPNGKLVHPLNGLTTETDCVDFSFLLFLFLVVLFFWTVTYFFPCRSVITYTCL